MADSNTPAPKPRTKPGPKPIKKHGMTVNPDTYLKTPIEIELLEEYGREITVRQKSFCELYVEGRMTGAECARQAGYAYGAEIATRLLNGRDFPHIPKYISVLREEKERIYGVTMMGQLERLYKLSKGAEDSKQFSAAINAEKIRSALGGLTVDRRENVNTIDQMTRDQITARLADLQAKYPQAFIVEGTFTEVENGRTRGKRVGKYEEITAVELPRNED
jgi:hypothetical protein